VLHFIKNCSKAVETKTESGYTFTISMGWRIKEKACLHGSYKMYKKILAAAELKSCNLKIWKSPLLNKLQIFSSYTYDYQYYTTHILFFFSSCVYLVCNINTILETEQQDSSILGARRISLSEYSEHWVCWVLPCIINDIQAIS
jgi:hypothetical protein